MEKESGIDKVKTAVIREVDAHRRQLTQLGHRIHANPELGLHETKAAAWLGRYLEKNGFHVELGICGLATAFRGSYGTGQPVVAILAEYDALPGMGHGCGHNLIAAGAVGAGVAARRAVDRFGGRIVVLGTPGEERDGGKILMAEKGAFDDIDIAMMFHPGGHDVIAPRALAAQALWVEFFGKEAHAAARPEAGINALEAMINSFVAINSLRQHITSGARIHGIITDGGQAPNIVPGHSAGVFIIRAEDDDYLAELKERVLNCFIGAATSSGARLEHRWAAFPYASLRTNNTLARLFGDNMAVLGRQMLAGNPQPGFGSTDMGNISRRVPSIQPLVAIHDQDFPGHSPQFVAAAASTAGITGCLDAAKAMAMTVVDLVANPVVVIEVREEFQGKHD